MNLLIVDDEPIVLQGLLNGIDWNRLQFRDVLSASSFEEALDVLKQNSVDILLTDIELSEKNGLDLVEWVKENHPGVRCVILSCHDEFPYAQRAVRLECVDYVLKPIPYAQLTEILAKAKEKVLSERGRTELEDYGKAYFTYLKRNDSKPEKKDAVEAATKYIKAHISDELSVEELAGFVGLSPRHLSRLFQKKLGQNVPEYITKERMTVASRLLADPDISVTMVSDRCGYCNYSYFIRQFKKYFGVTPGEYQKSRKAGG